MGDGLDVAVVGALNVSPESFYSGSVVVDADRLLLYLFEHEAASASYAATEPHARAFGVSPHTTKPKITAHTIIEY